MLLLNSGWTFITAQQLAWWMKGGEGKLRIKGKRWRSSRTSPAGPGTCPGQQLQLLLWRKSQLSLATSDLPPPVSSPAAAAVIHKPLSSVFSLILSLIPGLNWKLPGIYQGGIRSLCPCFCALPVVFSIFTPPNDESARLHGVNMWALQVLKYHPLPGKQWQCRQPCRLVTSLFFDPPTFL